MIAVIQLLTVSLALTDVRVATLDEQTIGGQLVHIDAGNVVVKTESGTETSIALGEVIDVTVQGSQLPENGPSETEQIIVLHDGSVMPAADIGASAETVEAQTANIGTLKIPRAAVRAIRLQPLQVDWTPQWDTYLQRSNKKDLLIIAKQDGSGLDFLAGIVSSMEPETVAFLLDGDQIPVPRGRVFGVIFAAKDRRTAALKGDISVQWTSGTSVRAAAVTLDSGLLKIASSWGQKLTASADTLSKIDFSGGRIHFLSDLEPLSERYFGLDPPGSEWSSLFEEDRDTRIGLSRQWKMSRDRFPNSGRPQLTLRGRTWAKGLCVFPSAKIEYALDGRYSGLTAIVGVDDEVAFNQLPGKPPTAVELRIEADGEEVFRHLVSAPSDPLPLQLKLNGVTTLTIIVDFGDGASTCDYLDIANARLFVDTSAE